MSTKNEKFINSVIRTFDFIMVPYYRQQLNQLSPQQCKILATIADRHGEAITISRIAWLTFLSPQGVSRQLCDLLQEGYVKRTQIGRESYYEIADPLLRCYFELTKGNIDYIINNISFLITWYKAKDIKKD